MDKPRMFRPALCFASALLLSAHASAFQSSVVSIPSAAMRQSFGATIVVPDDYAKHGGTQRYPVVYLLHGSDGDHTDWTANSRVGELADLYHVILVMPDGGHETWYMDSPFDPNMRYETYVGSEVVTWVDAHFRTIATKEARAITGLSMGGFGALHIALARPDTFGAAGSMSGAVDPRVAEDEPGIDRVFGNPAQHAAFWNDSTIVANAREFQRHPIDLTIECGVDDGLVESNRALHERLLALRVPHDYAERPGGHTWAYWSNAIRYQMLFFTTSFRRNGWKPPHA